MAKLVYKQYLQTLANLFDYLEQHAQRAFASHDNAYHVLGADGDRIALNKQFRALYRLPSEQIQQVSKLIEQAQSLYQQAHQANDKEQGDKIPKRPLYLPYLLQDDSLETITLHENTAHSSHNFRGDDLVPVAQVCVKYGRNGDVINDVAKDRADLVKMIEDSGFEYTIKMIDEANLWEQFYIKAIDLSNRFQCDSIQLRQATGKQYRYSMFGIDKNGYKTASKPKSLGVMVLVGDVKIIAPMQRKQRTDAITNNHPDVIHLDFVTSGVMHRKFDYK